MDDSPFRALPLLEEYFPGSLIDGKYRLETLVGQGGMGSVWRANNVVLDMPVAIKLIRPEVRGAGTTELLLNEARLVAKLQHPSVVRLFDFGTASTGDAFIVMELLKGPSLAEVLERRGRMSSIEAVRLILPIVHGLSAAHRRGIAHLDLKPENILISELGMRPQPKLLDFGIAKKIELHNNLTASERLVGSPAYMSPEQALGSGDIDARADVWGICVVLYELVSGRLPFTAESASETLRAVMENEPAPLSGSDADARALWPIVRAGLAKDREQRIGSARALGDALAQWLIERDEHHDVCGEQLVSSWGPAARTRSLQLAANDTAIVLAPPRKHRRSLWVGAAACLSLAALFCLDGVEQTGLPARARVAPERPSTPSHEPIAVPQLIAATSQVEQEPAEIVSGSVAKASAVTTHLRAPARVTRLSSKRAVNAQRARSREAELGLKDPFE